MEHVRRSGGGLYFESYRTFEATVERLVGDGAIRARLGKAGRQYTERYYRWPSIIDRYSDFLASVVARGPRTSIRTGRLPLVTDGPAYQRGG
jgi:glycosyltransferase involved in cell wall biosynthesis